MNLLEMAQMEIQDSEYSRSPSNLFSIRILKKLMRDSRKMHQGNQMRMSVGNKKKICLRYQKKLMLLLLKTQNQPAHFLKYLESKDFTCASLLSQCQYLIILK